MTTIDPTATSEKASSEGSHSTRAQLASEYIDVAKHRLLKGGAASMTLVCGNEAGDLDTIVSALALAYGLEHAVGGGAWSVALCPFPRSEFRLRADAKQLFLEAGFTLDDAGAPSALLFWDEVNWAAIREGGAVLALTDHNKASDLLCEAFGGRVELIIDHHADSKAHPAARRKIDEGAGSCCTLIAEWLEENGVRMPPDLGALLLGTILVDVKTFSTEHMRFNSRDERAFAKLQGYLPAAVLANGGGVPEEAVSKWYEKLKDARYDVTSLSVNDLLRLDYKEVEAGGLRVGFSSVFATLDGAVTLAGDTMALLAELQAFAEEKKLDLLFALTQRGPDPLLNGEFKGIITLELGDRAAGVGAAVCSFLEAAPDGLSEQLQTMPLFEKQGILKEGFGIRQRADLSPLCAVCLNRQITRKTLMPAVASFLQMMGAGSL